MPIMQKQSDRYCLISTAIVCIRPKSDRFRYNPAEIGPHPHSVFLKRRSNTEIPEITEGFALIKKSASSACIRL